MEELMPAIEILDRLCVEYRILKTNDNYALYFIISASAIDELSMYRISDITRRRGRENKDGIVYLKLFSGDCAIYSHDNEADYDSFIKCELRQCGAEEIFCIRPILKLLNL